MPPVKASLCLSGVGTIAAVAALAATLLGSILISITCLAQASLVLWERG